MDETDKEYRAALIAQIPDAINQLIELMDSEYDAGEDTLQESIYSHFRWTKIVIEESYSWDHQLNGMAVRAYSIDKCYIYAAYIQRYGIIVDAA